MFLCDPERLDTASFAAFRIRLLVSEHIGLGRVDVILLHRFQRLGECPVELFGVLQCKVATSNTGLVRDDNQQITQFLKNAECFGYTGQ